MAYLSKMKKKYYLEAFREYKKIYGPFYDSDALEYIENNMFNENFDNDIIVDIINQVFETIGVNSELEHNIYKDFLIEMRKYYDVNKDLLEVSSGMVPAFALKLKELQTKGSITVIDPDTIKYNFEGIDIIRDNFRMSTDISPYDLIYAIEPCGATMDIIKKANVNDKDLILMMCGCTHFLNPSIFGFSIVEWMNQVKYLLETTLPEGRKSEVYNKSYLPYPIIRTYKR